MTLIAELRSTGDNLRRSGLDQMAEICDRAAYRMTLDEIEIAALKARLAKIRETVE